MHHRLHNHRQFLIRSVILVAVTLSILLSFAVVSNVKAHPYPPYWQNGSGTAVHYPPAAWPGEAAWITYSREGHEIKDPRDQDPSNGGTSPQNYVNVTSGCTDQIEPSVYYAYDNANETLFFRWRVQQIANTYATGPNPGTFSATDPWNSALWTVLIDLNGDGFRDFAIHIDGSSGSPAKPIDILAGVYSNTLSQSIDYINDPNVHLLAHNPTAFVDQSSNRLLNFHNSLAPTAVWRNGSSETVWDYGTTRSTKMTGAGCTQFFIDYQIPLDFLDATAVGGPEITPATPISLLFVTANSLNNPLQKDAITNGDYISNPAAPAPFGDAITLAENTFQQPIISSITAAGCSNATLTARIMDVINNNATTSVTAVDFYAYHDGDGDGLANDGGEWDWISGGANAEINRWTATWNPGALLQGQYLIGVQAVDNAANNEDDLAHRAFSYLTAAEVAALSPAPGEGWYANPSPEPGVQVATFLNSCGTPLPYISKTADPAQVTAGDTVTFTITVHNTLGSAVTLSQIADSLPAGFTYLETVGGTLNPTTFPSGGSDGDVSWTFAPAASIPGSSTATLIFTAAAPLTAGSYANFATAATSYGLLAGDPASVDVGLPRLTIGKSASAVSVNPGDTITYTITYANDSTVSVTGAAIADVVPDGLSNVTVLDGGSYNSSTRTATWTIGDLAAGDGPFSVRLEATVANPYPDSAAVPLVNSATIDANETSPATASASTYVNAPRSVLAIQKTANATQIVAGGQIQFTIDYANTGNSPATGVTITDAIPAGFSYVSASPAPTSAPAVGANGTVVWNDDNLAAGATGSVQLTVQAANPYNGANPVTNTAVIDSDQTTPAADAWKFGVTRTGSVCNTYYFRNQTADVGSGVDGGNRRLANTTAPTSATAATVLFNATSTPTEAIRFYQDPATTNELDFAGTLTTYFYIDKASGPKLFIDAYVYDYNPDDGTKILLGSASFDKPGNGTNVLFDFPVSVSGTLPKGHRLMWRFDAYSNQTTTFTFRFDGTPSPSRAAFCVSPPAELVVDKQVSSLATQPGGNLQYTINFANIGQAAATGATITDTLPDGVTFTGATLNGAAVSPVSVSGRQYTFPVRSSDTSSDGLVTGAQSGTLVINATVAEPLDRGIFELQNTAVLESNETAPVEDTAATSLLRPEVSIAKAAGDTLLIPGDTVTYALTVLNSGRGAATNVTITDTLPVAGYYTYVAGSARLDGVTVDPDPVSGDQLSLNAGSLAAGESAVVTYQMQVGSNVPAGIVTHDNTAYVGDDQTTGSQSSETVTVTISSNPNLRLEKQMAPGGVLAPGDLITYTLTLANAGSSDALDVQVSDPIPANTSYVAGSLVYEGAAQTDAADGDAGRYELAGNRVVFGVGTLPAQASRTIQFTVRLDTTLPAGSTSVTNTATAVASNTAGKSDTVAGAVEAVPDLAIEKRGPDVVTYPAARLTTAANATTTLQLDDTGHVSTGQYVLVNGQQRLVTAVGASSITVASNVTAAAGDAVVASFSYSLVVTNQGNAAAGDVTVADTLPAGATFVTATAPYAENNGEVTWSVGDLDPGAGRVLALTVFPTGSGSLMNTATAASDETAPVSDEATTATGGLVVRKSTTTPTVTQTATGATATYVIAVENTLSTPASNVVVTDTFPAGFTYLATGAISGYDTHSGATTPAVGDEQPAWGAFTIAGGETLLITFTAQVAPTVGPAVYQNEVMATSSDTAVTPFDPLATTAEDVQVQVPVVELAKSVTPGTVGAGGIVTYTITLSNQGDATAAGIVVSDELPAGFTYQETVEIIETGATRTGTLEPDDNTQPQWGTWDVAANGAITIVFRAKSAAAVGTFWNTVAATSTNTTIPGLEATAPVTTTAAADLSIVKSSQPNPAIPGGTITYTLVVANAGPSDAPGAVVADTLPAVISGVTWQCVASAGSSCGGSGSGDVDDTVSLAAGGALTYTISGSLHAAAVSDVVNTATVTPPDSVPDSDTGNNSDADTNTPAPTILTGVITDSSTGLPIPGATVVVTDTLGHEYTTTTDAAGVYVFTSTIGQPLAAGPATVSAAAGGYQPAMATPTLVGGTTNKQDLELTPDVTRIQATKTAALHTDLNNNGQPSPGDTLSYTITISNSGSTAVTGIVLDDTPDANTSLVVGSVAATQGNVIQGNGSGHTTVQVEVGTLNPGQSATITFRVTIAASLPPSVTHVSNQGVVSSNELPDHSTDDPGTTEQNDDTATAVPQPGIAIQKILESGSPAYVTELVTYTIRITNTGNTTLVAIPLTDTFDLPYLNYAQATPAPDTVEPAFTAAQGRLAWNDVTDTLGDLAPGEALTVQVVMTAAAVTPENVAALNRAAVQNVLDENGLSPAGGSVETGVGVTILSNVQIAKVLDTTGVIQVGDDLSFTITITNVGRTDIVTLPLSDTYDAAYLNYRNATPAPNSAAPGSIQWHDLTQSFGNLASGEAFQVNVTFRAAAVASAALNHAAVHNALDNLGFQASAEAAAPFVISEPTAVELLYFSVEHLADFQVQLTWATAMEIDNFGFMIFRAPVNDLDLARAAGAVDMVPSAVPGGTGPGKTYSYLDTVPDTGRWWYWLADVDTNGLLTFHEPATTRVADSSAYRIYLPFMANR